MPTSRLLVVVAVFVAACGPPETGEAPAAASAVYLEGATLIRGDGSEPIESGAFVVEDGRITEVGASGSVDVPEDARTVSLEGKTVMPMLMDLHGHVGFLKDGVFAAENYTRENIIEQLERSEFYGVGAILSLGTDVGVAAKRVREDQRSGKLGGATLFLAGRGFVAPGGGPMISPLEHVPFEVDHPVIARMLVRELAAENVDMIKVWVDDRLGRRPKLAPEIYRAVIDEAHENGIRVMAHVYYLADAKDLVRAGVDGFAHMVRDVEVDDELVRLAKENDVFFCGALSGHAKPVEAWIDDPAFAETTPPSVRERLRAEAAERGERTGPMRPEVLLPRMHASIQKLAAGGVRLALGGDTGIPRRFHGFNQHLELEAYVDAGLSPLEAIRAATSVPAEILGLSDRGMLAAGKSADFIVLDGNPLEDIANTRRIADVYRRGVAIDRAELGWRREEGR